MTTISLLIATALQAAASHPAPPLLRKLACVDRLNHRGHPQTDPFLTRTRATALGLRLEYLRVYPGGQVVFVVSVHDFGTIDCQATLTSERLASFRTELRSLDSLKGI